MLKSGRRPLRQSIRSCPLWACLFVSSSLPVGLQRARNLHVRSIVKAISWRGTGSLDTFFVTFVITGSFKFAGSIAVTEILTKVVLYYFHERIWSMIPWGRAANR